MKEGIVKKEGREGVGEEGCEEEGVCIQRGDRVARDLETSEMGALKILYRSVSTIRCEGALRSFVAVSFVLCRRSRRRVRADLIELGESFGIVAGDRELELGNPPKQILRTLWERPCRVSDVAFENLKSLEKRRFGGREFRPAWGDDLRVSRSFQAYERRLRTEPPPGRS